jgi:inorganic pyrophosphatase
MLRTFTKRSLSRLVFCKSPNIRNKTLSGVEFDVQIKVQSKEDNRQQVENKTWSMVNKETGALMSPWHDIEIESTVNDDNCVTGVIEMTAKT